MENDSTVHGRNKVQVGDARRITILGMGMSAIERRWNIQEWCKNTPEVWGMNNGYLQHSHALPMFTRWWELHEWNYLKEWSEAKSGARQIPGCRDHFEVLNRLNIPVMCTEALPGIAKQEVIDWVRVFVDLQGDERALRKATDKERSAQAMLASNYFLGSPSLMMAYALWEHDQGNTIEEIQTWGIDTSDDSHSQQRQSWAYWCAQAHCRGIEMSGTALNFMQEKEEDGGLIGLRDMIGQQISKTTQQRGSYDYVIVSHYTDDKQWSAHADRLRKECDALGVAHDIRSLGKIEGEYRDKVLIARRKVMQTVERALKKHKRPVIWMDVDDHLEKAPTLPPELDGVGYIENPEKQVLGTNACAIGSFFAITPTERGARCMAIMKPIEKLTAHHRAVQALWGAGERSKAHGLMDITQHFRGCFRISPSWHRANECHT